MNIIWDYYRQSLESAFLDHLDHDYGYIIDVILHFALEDIFTQVRDYIPSDKSISRYLGLLKKVNRIDFGISTTTDFPSFAMDHLFGVHFPIKILALRLVDWTRLQEVIDRASELIHLEIHLYQGRLTIPSSLRLKTLALLRTKLDDWSTVSFPSSLRTINFQESNFNGTIPPLPHLEELNLRKIQHHDWSLVNFSPVTLNRLFLGGTNYNLHLPEFPHLRNLSLHDMHRDDWCTFRFPPSLVILCMSKSNCNWLPALPNLEYLYFMYCMLDDWTGLHFPPSLIKLDLEGSDCPPEMYEYLPPTIKIYKPHF